MVDKGHDRGLRSRALQRTNMGKLTANQKDKSMALQVEGNQFKVNTKEMLLSTTYIESMKCIATKCSDDHSHKRS